MKIGSKARRLRREAIFAGQFENAGETKTAAVPVAIAGLLTGAIKLHLPVLPEKAKPTE
jgi:hypothetical protein